MMERMDQKTGEEGLKADLRRVVKPDLGCERKMAMKNNIMSRLELPVIRYIRNLVARVRLDPSRRALIKEHIFDLLERRRQKYFYFSNVFSYHKKWVSAFVLFMMVFSMFAALHISVPNVVMAETFTILDSFSGEVTIERDGKVSDVEEDMRLYENDRIVTGDDGFASIRFFDDSMSRLAAGSEIVVNKLFRPSETSVKSYVEISVLDGAVWARVVNLVERESSFVVKAGCFYASSKRAGFNVRVYDDEVEIEVFDHVVDVRVDGELESTEKVASGQRVVMSGGNEVHVQEIDEGEEQLAWVQENLSSDKLYLLEVEERLFAAKLESIGVEVDEDFEFGGSVLDEVSLFLTFDDVKRKKKELDFAEKDFVAAGIRLSDSEITEEEREEVQAILKEFSDLVEDFYDFVEEVSYTDSEYAEELKKYVGEKILMHKKSLSLLLPDSPSYATKTLIGELELLGADDDVELVGLKRGQILSTLSDAEQAVKSGDSELASVVVEEYKEDLDEVMEIIDSMDDESSDVREGLAEDVAEDVELLDSIKVVSDDEVMEIKDDLSRISGEGEKTVSDDTDDEDLERATTYDVELQGDKPLSPLLY